MPIYTYRCENCGVQFERQQSFTDAPLKTCPECRKKALKKVITPTGIIFKGSGFYANDHKSPSGGSSRSSKKEEPKKEESKPAAPAASSDSAE
jgi:putative FmdB family regulatory protein